MQVHSAAALFISHGKALSTSHGKARNFVESKPFS
jgi:hypothetical protein